MSVFFFLSWTEVLHPGVRRKQARHMLQAPLARRARAARSEVGWERKWVGMKDVNRVTHARTVR